MHWITNELISNGLYWAVCFPILLISNDLYWAICFSICLSQFEIVNIMCSCPLPHQSVLCFKLLTNITAEPCQLYTYNQKLVTLTFTNYRVYIYNQKLLTLTFTNYRAALNNSWWRRNRLLAIAFIILSKYDIGKKFEALNNWIYVTWLSTESYILKYRWISCSVTYMSEKRIFRKPSLKIFAVDVRTILRAWAIVSSHIGIVLETIMKSRALRIKFSVAQHTNVAISHLKWLKRFLCWTNRFAHL